MRAGRKGVGGKLVERADRINPVGLALLFLAVVLCALSVVTSQHKARKLFIELQKEKAHAQQMDVEWGQLQLEQSTWAAPARVEGVAVHKLQMRLPSSGQINFIRVQPNGGTKIQQ